MDQSPDVSHAPGEEGGDHLGGIDVDLVEVEGDDTAAGEVAALLDAGAAAVIVLDDRGSTAAVVGVADARGSLAIVATPGATPPGSKALVLEMRSAAEIDSASYESFAAAYTDTHGAAPSESAALGYDGGKLLDNLVAKFGARLRSGPQLTLQAERANDLLVASNVRASNEAAVGARSPDSRPGALVVGGTVAALGIGTALVLSRRRVQRRSSP